GDQRRRPRVTNCPVQRFGHRCRVRIAGGLKERALRPFEHDAVWKINDLGFPKGGEIILDRAESPAYPAIRGEKCDLIADMEIEASQANKLERAGEAGMAIHCKQV